jgi:hypothetical protein
MQDLCIPGILTTSPSVPVDRMQQQNINTNYILAIILIYIHSV